MTKKKTDIIVGLSYVIIVLPLVIYFYINAKNWLGAYNYTSNPSQLQMYKNYLWYICLTVSISALIVPNAIYFIYSLCRKTNNVIWISVTFLFVGIAFSFLYYYISINNDVYSFLPLGVTNY